MSGGLCSVCGCGWTEHVNTPHRIHLNTRTETISLGDIKARHEQFLRKHQEAVTKLKRLKEAEIEKSEEVQDRREKVMRHLRSLSETAYRRTEDSNTSYIDQMIQAEELEKKPGYEDRILQLKDKKVEEELLMSIKRDMAKETPWKNFKKLIAGKSCVGRNT